MTKLNNMNRELHAWHSPALNKTMEIAVYGHFGIPLLMLPTAAADYLEYSMNMFLMKSYLLLKVKLQKIQK